MTLEVQTAYDPNTPRTQHDQLAATMYGEIFKRVPSILNVAAGYTDLQKNLRAIGAQAEVTSLDAVFEGNETANRRFGYAQDLPFEDESFAATMCQFGMQHITSEQWGEAMREMVRVTQTADSPRDPSKGVVLINPVFKAKKLEAALAAAGVDGVEGIAGVSYPDTSTFMPSVRKRVRPTLWIHKTPELTPDKLDAIVHAATATEALKDTHRSLGEMVSRRFGGYSQL